MIATTHQLTLLPAPADPAPAPSLDALASVDPALSAARNLLALWLADSKTDSTRRTYSAALDDFRLFLSEPTPAHAIARLLAAGKGTTTAVLESYRAVLLEGRKLAPATVNCRVGAVRSVLVKAFDLDIVTWFVRVKGVKSSPLKDTRGPGSEAVAAMYAEIVGRRDAKGARDRCIVALLWDLALRRGELASLDVSHVDLEKSVVWAMGKGRREREWLSLPVPTRAALTEWLAHRGDWPGPLLVGLSNHAHGQRLSGNSLHRIVAALGKRVGVRTWPHALRHSAITAALDATQGDVRTVRLYSRHRSVETLLRYDDQRQDKAGGVAAVVAELRGG